MAYHYSDSELTSQGRGSRTDRYRKVRDGRFPQPLNVGTAAAPRNRWPSDELAVFDAGIRSRLPAEEATRCAMAVRAAVADGQAEEAAVEVGMAMVRSLRTATAVAA